jgi:hypothetical protein
MKEPSLRLNCLKKQVLAKGRKRKIKDPGSFFAGSIPALTSRVRNQYWAVKLKEKLQISDLN